MSITDSLAKDVGIKPACDALVVSRASFYRWQNQGEDSEKEYIRPLSPLALSPYEQQQVLDTLHDERFADKAPQEVYAALLDGGSYLCSVRTMYRILEAHKEVKERRNQLRHPCIHQTRTACRRTKPGLVLGYYKTQGAGKVDLLLPLCHPRYLQPVRRGLDGGIQGAGNTGKKTD